MSKPADRIPELIRDWSDIASQVLAESGLVAPEEAQQLGMRVARSICEEYAGLQFYVPVGFAMRTSERDQAIYRASEQGMLPEALARQHKLGLQQIYRIIRRVRAVQIAERQQQLFDPAS